MLSVTWCSAGADVPEGDEHVPGDHAHVGQRGPALEAEGGGQGADQGLVQHQPGRQGALHAPSQCGVDRET